MNTQTLARLAACRAAAVVALGIAAALALPAGAQPAGNPKGSVTPPPSDAQKAPATRGPTGAFGDSGKIVTDPQTEKSRSQTLESPGSVVQSRPSPSASPGGSGADTRSKGDKDRKRADPAAKPVPR